MKKLLLPILLLLAFFTSQSQTTNLFPYCNNFFPGVYNSINYMTFGAYTKNFGPLGDAFTNPNVDTYYNNVVLPDLQVGIPTNVTMNFYVAPDAEAMYWAVLIDLNLDGFYDPFAGELFLDNASTNGQPLPCLSGVPMTINSSITIPAGTMSMTTRMRVVRYSDFFGATPQVYDPFMVYSDCYSFGFNYGVGCTYDFDVNIVAPEILVNPTILSGFTAVVGTPSPNQQITVSGTNLQGNIDLVAPTHYEISTNSSTGFGTNVSLTPVGGIVSPTIVYVRYNPSVAGSHTGFITLNSFAAGTQFVSVSGNSTAPVIPTISINPPVTLTPFTAFVGFYSASQSFNIEGIYLTNNVNITAPAEFEISTVAGSGYTTSLVLSQSAGILASTTIYVRYNPSAVGVHSGNISCFSIGSNTINIPVTGTASIAPPPAVLATPTTAMSFNAIVGIPSVAQTVSVSGTYLIGDITLAVAAPFEISTSIGSGYASTLVLTPLNGTVNATTIYVRFNPQIPNSYAGDLNISSPGTTSIVIPLTGVGLANTPVVTLNPATLNYFVTTFGLPSPNQNIYVSGLYLISPLVVNAPQHFQISTQSNAGFGNYLQLNPTVTGAVASTIIYVRYNPSTPGNHQGDLIVSSSGAISDTIQLNGYAYPVSVENLSENETYIYPTSTSGLVYVSSNLNNEDVRVYDLNGKLVLNETVRESQFTMNYLTAGIYLVQFGNEEKKRFKIIKE